LGSAPGREPAPDPVGRGEDARTSPECDGKGPGGAERASGCDGGAGGGSAPGPEAAPDDRPLSPRRLPLPPLPWDPVGDAAIPPSPGHTDAPLTDARTSMRSARSAIAEA